MQKTDKVESTGRLVGAERGALERDRAPALYTLPVNLIPDQWSFEQVGFLFGGPVGEKEVQATLPKGWSYAVRPGLAGADNLYDTVGYLRGEVLVREPLPQARLYHRYRYALLSVTPRDFSRVQAVVSRRDATEPKEIWRSDVVEARTGEAPRDTDHRVRTMALDWLRANFPNWNDVTAYWL